MSEDSSPASAAGSIALHLTREFFLQKDFKTSHDHLLRDLGKKPESCTRAGLARSLGIVKHFKKAKASGGNVSLLEVLIGLQLFRKKRKTSKQATFSVEGSTKTAYALIRNYLRRSNFKKTLSSFLECNDNSGDISRELGMLKLVQKQRQQGIKRSVLETLVDYQQKKRALAAASQSSQRKTASKPGDNSSAASPPISPTAATSSNPRRNTNSSSSASVARRRGGGEGRSNNSSARNNFLSYGSSSPETETTNTMTTTVRTKSVGSNRPNSREGQNRLFGSRRKGGEDRGAAGLRRGAEREPMMKKKPSSPKKKNASACRSEEGEEEEMLIEEIDNMDLGMDNDDIIDMHPKEDTKLSMRGPSNRKGGILSASSTNVPRQLLSSIKVSRLKTLLFGTPKGNFREEWKYQGFYFKKAEELEAESLGFGLVQRKGGPCGVLAAVQCEMVRFLLFDNETESKADKTKSDWKKVLGPNSSILNAALTSALTEILWRAGSERKCTVVVGRDLNMPYSATFTSKSSTRDFIVANLHSFQKETGPGVCFLVYSIMLSHGIEECRKEMDETSNRLIVDYGYCAQELVNLCTLGKAVSHVHSGECEFAGKILRGVEGESCVGLLSLLEHFKYVEVGKTLKSPRYPIWIVYSESHYSMLFSPKLINDSNLFDLWYYDGLANQDEEIRLTVRCNANVPEDNEDDLVPPLNRVIRTKWPGAEIDWNGVEPLL